MADKLHGNGNNQAKRMKRILSLGAGVQSSTLALMIAHGELSHIDAAIFADTQWEPRHVYTWLDWLESEIQRLPNPFPIYRVTEGSLREDAIRKQKSNGGRFAAIPWHIMMPNGDRAMGRRQCTAEYKLKPLRRKQRELLGLAKGQRSKGVLCETLIGISTDEAMRMKPSRDPWAKSVWPLVDKGMSRWDCLQWMEQKGYPLPPKSSCIGCPFHNDHEWRAIKADHKSWSDALEIDAIIREPARGMQGKQFMHRSCKPLDEVDLSTAEDHGQVDMFNNECEGMCGV
jgi:hypothetical protein